MTQRTSALTLSRQQALKLAEEATDLADWLQINAFAAQVYGENKAIKVTIEIYEEYDDENYSYPIGSIIAYDANGDAVSPDYTLPFFQTEEWQRSNKEYEGYEYGFVEKLREIPASTKKKQNWHWLLIDDLPHNDKTYDLTTAPLITLPTQEVTS